VTFAWWLDPLVPWTQLPWLAMSPLEVVATLFGLLSVWYYVKEHVLSWPTGLLNVALSIALFWNGKLYADAALQVVYVVLQFYGWWQWLHGGAQRQRLTITRTSPQLWYILSLCGAAGTGVIVAVLKQWSDSTTPWPDAAITSLSLVAQWMISKKKLENWFVWILVDLISIPLLIYKQLYLYAGLYAIFLVLCIVGLITWRKTYRSSGAA
jgi:nicotinamide mononucleotide transporter